MKFLALYLPQYHTFPENDEWWGKGYTEWSAVRSAKPIYKGHNEPRIPLNNNYYDLKNNGYETWKWQADLAKQYGIYGFCIYQYWFCGKQLMERPAEILLENKDIDIHYCFCWANETWTKTWYGLENEILIEQTCGTKEDWIKHFNYMLPYFKDKRYIKKDNKPMLCVYRPQDIICLPEMLGIWNELAIKNGFSGIALIGGQTAKGVDNRSDLFDAYYNFEPGLTIAKRWKGIGKRRYQLRNHLTGWINKKFNKQYAESLIKIDEIMPFLNGYMAESDIENNVYLGAFPQWDNTPRRSYKGLAYLGTSPENFRKQLKRIKEIDTREDSFVFINAWNEWGEGCYLEPDTKQQYSFLNVVKEFVDDI